jgi:hypothetical protein
MDKSPIHEVEEEIPCCYETLMFITVFSIASHWALFETAQFTSHLHNIFFFQDPLHY